jgi:hypothetical protein
MNSELDKLRQEITREEFMEYIMSVHKEPRSCPSFYDLSDICGETQSCEACWKNAVQDIRFKDDELDTNEIERAVDKFDPVEKPKHYNSGKFEVIEIIESIVNSMNLSPFEGYCIGNSLKYIARFKNKNGIEDIKKAQWHLERLIKEGAKVE